MSSRHTESLLGLFKAALSLLAGATLTAAFAPYQLDWLAPVSVAVFFLIALATTARRAFLTGFLFGLGFYGFGVSWVYNSIHLFGEAVAPLALAATAVFVAVLALFPALQLWLFSRLRSEHRNRPANVSDALLFTALWSALELLRSKLMGGFPWILLGYSQTDTPLNALAPIIGVYGIGMVLMLIITLSCVLLRSWWAAWRGQAAAALRLPRRQQGLALALSGVCFALIMGAQELSFTEPTGRELNLRIVQGNVPQSVKFSRERVVQSLSDYQRLSMEALPTETDLIIWPETAIATSFANAEAVLNPLVDALKQRGTDILTGGFLRENELSYNSVRVLGSPEQLYRKRHLVPFGEYVPFRSLLAPLARYIDMPMGDQRPWTGPHEPLQVGAESIGVSICYEDVYGEEMRPLLPSSTLLVNVSNDAWFGDSAAPHQHEQKARMRALEFARPMVRVTNTGISSFIAADGTVTGRIGYDEAGWLDQTVATRQGRTPYVVLGNAPVYLSALLVIATALAGWLRRRRW